ncbi:hypothetical protein ASG43_02340 [Aureimonas sp. Leaf454]|uniref:hypothetical protein n=1 Tax=Aureimonas sp. Leaf454 TaxID=1736381 RepID=UPI0006F65425|nr:hypothetical protein [Aureimonas sp. Leaf454]KQT54459.1 hypothetical protein ASG43_02340 [Aureimonas sp. Leaf454]
MFDIFEDAVAEDQGQPVTLSIDGILGWIEPLHHAAIIRILRTRARVPVRQCRFVAKGKSLWTFIQ